MDPLVLPLEDDDVVLDRELTASAEDLPDDRPVLDLLKYSFCVLLKSLLSTVEELALLLEFIEVADRELELFKRDPSAA